MGKGLFLVSRELFKHPVVGLHKPIWFAAWVWMLGEARWKDSKIDHGGKTIILKRGQLSHSLRFMSERLGMSIKGIRVFLARLEKDTLIVTDKGTVQTIITICNYENYQDFEKYRAQLGAQPRAHEGHGRGTAGAQTRTPDLTPDGTPDETPDVLEAAKASPKKPAKRGTRIDKNWMATEQDIKHAIDKGFSQNQINAIGQQFYDHWIQATGKGATSLDWAAKWRTWITNDIKWHGDPRARGIRPKGNGGSPSQAVAFQRSFDDIERENEERGFS